ncbi:MAG: hypothetical protein EPO08_15910 [Rhodospirillaceae bacterium]|nr:MAG: hypothetical protein EPO08_15910 [Rhodospirillaceae bacterium]
MFTILWMRGQSKTPIETIESPMKTIRTVIESADAMAADVVARHPEAPPDRYVIVDANGSQVDHVHLGGS